MADLVFLLVGGGVGANGIVIQEHPSRSWGMYSSFNLAADETVRGGGLPTTSALDPVVVLAVHPTVRDVLGRWALA